MPEGEFFALLALNLQNNTQGNLVSSPFFYKLKVRKSKKYTFLHYATNYKQTLNKF